MNYDIPALHESFHLSEDPAPDSYLLHRDQGNYTDVIMLIDIMHYARFQYHSYSVPPPPFRRDERVMVLILVPHPVIKDDRPKIEYYIFPMRYACFPFLKNTGIVLRGASTRIVCPPSKTLPVRASVQLEPPGKYTSLVKAPS